MPLAWYGSFVVLEGFVSRADNWYWVQLILPAYLIGWLFIPLDLLRRPNPN
jgi:hypothetical protein